jgi:TolB-like protein/Flp pilus assembly protein TadD
VGYFLQELKRRNVVRVGVAYLVVSWLVIQVIETVSRPLSLPAWTEAFFIVLMLAGFPVACLFAWAFELTPEGVKKTEEVDKEVSVTASTGRKLDFAIIAALVLALGYFLWERQQTAEPMPDSPAAVTKETSGTSIAVLPFVDMSSEQDQEYFSDGISEELLNVLAKIPELRVAARTSSFQFKGQNLDIAEVAEQLNVQHVLEGSVRKADTRVRVTAQLIQADTGFHVWSETYDRELNDIFAIQDEISAAIVAALSTTLGLDGSAAPKVSAETNTEAYNAYLLGQHLIRQRTATTIEAAATHFQEAIDLDPDYAPAHASLALASHLLTQGAATYGTLTLQESKIISDPHIARALELDPDLADAQAIKGLLLFSEQQVEESLAYFDKALELNPSHNDARSWYRSALAALGRYDEGYAVIRKAYELDPLSNLTFNNYSFELAARRDSAELEKVISRYQAIDPTRAASFRALLQDQNRQAADGVVTLLQAAAISPEVNRVQNFAAFELRNIGLRDEALTLWTNPRTEFIFLDPLDDEGYLIAAQQRFDEEPDDLGNLEMLAWAKFAVDETDEALELANRYLAQLGEIRRPIDSANQLIAMAAWERQDTETMLQHLAPLKADRKSRIAVGIDTGDVYWELAVYSYMQGSREESLQQMKTALSREMLNDGILWEFDRLKLDDEPEFAAVMADYQAYLATERAKLLAKACGEIGFNNWQPKAETCDGI